MKSKRNAGNGAGLGTNFVAILAVSVEEPFIKMLKHQGGTSDKHHGAGLVVVSESDW